LDAWLLDQKVAKLRHKMNGGRDSILFYGFCVLLSRALMVSITYSTLDLTSIFMWTMKKYGSFVVQVPVLVALRVQHELHVHVVLKVSLGLRMTDLYSTSPRKS
jgi:hypothetical protein